MKRKHFLLAGAAVLLAGGWWFARSGWRTPAVQAQGVDVGAGVETPPAPPKPGQGFGNPGSRAGVGLQPHAEATHAGRMPRPPEPNRRFMDFTPEQRVEFARKGHGPGG